MIRKLLALTLGAFLLPAFAQAQSIVGTPAAITLSGQDPAGQAVTVETGATAFYFFWAYNPAAGAGIGLASVTLAAAAPDDIFEVPSTGNDITTGVAAWYSPSTGSQTLDVAWDADPSNAGPVVIVASTSGGDTTAWRDADGDEASSTSAVSATITTESGDLVIKLDMRFDSGTGAPALSTNWTSGQTQTNNDLATRLSYITASGATQVCDSENELFSTVVCISIPAAAGSAPTLTSPTPSGTLGTETTATLGATSDDDEGTFYGVVDDETGITDITASQIKLGNDSGDASAIAACDDTVSTTSPSCGVTGLTANTAYHYAVVHTNPTGDSNVETGTFTTAMEASGASIPIIMHNRRQRMQ